MDRNGDEHLGDHPRGELSAEEHARLRTRIVADVMATFSEVEAQCTRFGPNHALVRWIGHLIAGTRRHPDCSRRSARPSEPMTEADDEPRILRTLEDLGYTETLPFGTGASPIEREADVRRRPPLNSWRPRFRGATSEVLIGGDSVDLVAWKGPGASLGGVSGGDKHGEFPHQRWRGLLLRGRPDGDQGWRVAIEDPALPTVPVAVLQLVDMAAATSSIRVRRWNAGGRAVHHLIDPPER